MFKTITNLGAAMLLSLGLTTTQAQTYVQQAILGTGTSGSATNQFNYPTGVAFTADGKILISDLFNKRISVWTQSGTSFGNFSTFGGDGTALNQFKDPSSLAIGTDGKIFIADIFNRRIGVWTQTGNTFGALTSFSITGAGYPTSAAISPVDGLIFVTELFSNIVSVWQQNSNNFTKITTFGGVGSGLNKLTSPYDVEIAPDGKIYVADQGNNRISVWTQSGVTFGALTTFGGPGMGPENTSGPRGIVVAPDGKLFVSNTNNNCISIWTNNGNNYMYSTSFGGTLFNNVPMQYPNKVRFAANGMVYVPDGGNNRVTVWAIPPPCTPPTIVTQPVSQSSCSGTNITFELSATGTNLTYAWSNGLSTTNTMTTTAAGTYTATVTGECGSPQITSDAIYEARELTKITHQPVGTTICGQARMAVTAVGFNISYAWSNGNSNTTSFLTSISNNYTITVSGLCGTEVSNTVNYTKLEAFNVVTTPFGKEVIAGQTATLVASATGSNITYLWSTGATTNSVSSLSAGNYGVTITGSCGMNTFSPRVEEIPYPTVTGLIVSGNPANGGLLTINGLGIANSKGTSLTINGVVMNDNILDIDNNQMLVTIPSGFIQNNALVSVLVSNDFDGQPLLSSLYSLLPINSNQPIPTTTGIILSGNPANSITIAGAGFVNGATVTVNGVILSNITVVNGNTIVATLPSGFNASTSLIPVIIQNPNQVAGGSLAVPVSMLNTTLPSSTATVTGITINGNVTTITSPTQITITGVGFTNNSMVTINGVAISVIAIIGTNILIVTLPVGVITSTSNVTIQVANQGEAASQAVSIVVVDATKTSTNLPTYQPTSFKISPNPYSNGELKIENGVGLLNIYNAQGSVVYSSVITSENTTLNLNLIKGIYFVKVGNQASKLVVE